MTADGLPVGAIPAAQLHTGPRPTPLDTDAVTAGIRRVLLTLSPALVRYLDQGEPGDPDTWEAHAHRFTDTYHAHEAAAGAWRVEPAAYTGFDMAAVPDRGPFDPEPTHPTGDPT